MRQGRILAEGGPNQLIAQYGVPTLEALFLKLSRQDDVTRTTPENELLYQIQIGHAESHHNHHHSSRHNSTSYHHHCAPHFNHAHHMAVNHRLGGSSTVAETKFDQPVLSFSNGGVKHVEYSDAGKRKN